MRFNRTFMLPFAAGEAGQFIPFLIGAMVFLAAILLAGAATLIAASTRWQAGLEGSATIVIVPSIVNASSNNMPDASEREIGEALRIIQNQPGVITAKPMSRQDSEALLAPVLGTVDLAGLPVPRLIDLGIDPTRFDAAAAQQLLRQSMPGARIDTNQSWTHRLIILVQSALGVALLCFGLIAAIAIMTMIFATASLLAVHAESVELMHLMGAEDKFIARAFARQCLRLSLTGGAVGMIAALSVTFSLTLLRSFTVASSTAFLPVFRLPIWGWLMMLAILPLAGLLAFVTARFTVLRRLGRLA